MQKLNHQTLQCEARKHTHVTVKKKMLWVCFLFNYGHNEKRFLIYHIIIVPCQLYDDDDDDDGE